jgi:cell division initiation protein
VGAYYGPANKGVCWVISPEEIEGADLPRTIFGGYKADKVTEHLRTVAWDVRRLLHERRQAKSEHERLEHERDRLRHELVRSERRGELEAAVLESAQNTAREIRDTARREAELVLKKATEHAARLRREVEQEHAARLAEVEGLKEGSAKLRAELRRFIRTLLNLVEPGDLDANMKRHEMMSDLERVVQAQRTAQTGPSETAEPHSDPDAVPSAGHAGEGDVAGEVAADSGRLHLSSEAQVILPFAGTDTNDESERVA